MGGAPKRGHPRFSLEHPRCLRPLRGEGWVRAAPRAASQAAATSWLVAQFPAPLKGQALEFRPPEKGRALESRASPLGAG
ncbi:hypothetical protein GCM10009801_21750 [Streptomyces albiaxialis]|uniref:Uncharacterized protein n=1 Tax=Streptomyces albiaxialis TaxID=329523 RepID=A0ABN2VSB2_9ACTN